MSIIFRILKKVGIRLLNIIWKRFGKLSNLLKRKSLNLIYFEKKNNKNVSLKNYRTCTIRAQMESKLHIFNQKTLFFRKKIEKLDWMYAGSATAAASGVAEEYLLGKRRVDSVLNNRNFVNSSHSQGIISKNLLSDDKIALDKDILRKVQEDPMFRIKQQEQALRKKRALLQKVKKPNAR